MAELPEEDAGEVDLDEEDAGEDDLDEEDTCVTLDDLDDSEVDNLNAGSSSNTSSSSVSLHC